MAQLSDTNKYTFTGEQVKGLLKTSYELKECEKTIVSLSTLIDTVQFKVNALDLLINDKNKQIKRIKMNKRRWRNATVVVSFASVLGFILK